MNAANTIASQLPYLRRFARALTGSQASGDTYVATLLEALIADPSIFDLSQDPRVESYRLLSRMWSSVPINSEKSEQDPDWEKIAARKLEAVAPRARQAFLLVAVEGFGLEDAAKVLASTSEEIQHLLAQASEEISKQVSADVMIIEDEPLIALDIESLIKGLGHTVTGIARTHDEAVKLADSAAPEIVLADIQLADGSSGIDAVNDILNKYNVPVVFITAYPERLLTGNKPEPAFLITKPFIPDMVKAIVSQALFFEQKAGRGKDGTATSLGELS